MFHCVCFSGFQVFLLSGRCDFGHLRTHRDLKDVVKCIRMVLLVLTAKIWRLGIRSFLSWFEGGVQVMLIGLSSFDVGSQGLAEDRKGRKGKKKKKGHMLNEDDLGSDPA